ncbi:protein S-acyltransferase [Sarracenia purpurea var. burkii]
MKLIIQAGELTLVGPLSEGLLDTDILLDRAETLEDLYEWKAALDEALAQSPSATLVVGQNGIFRNDQTDAFDGSVEQTRYVYLRSPDGKFHNPYNHGCRKNYADFLIHGYTVDYEIAWPSLQQVAR